MVITPGKNFIGQEGFPTPSDIPADTACRSFVLPDNDEWFGLLMGAIELLLNPHNYFNYGALSIDDTVDAWQLIIQDAYDRSLTAQCAPEIPAPYWETAANVLDEAPSLVQSWYGQLFGGLTFIEALGNIFVGAFVLAGAGLGATIQFLVLARRFRLAFRAHDLGSIVRIFINADEYGTVDTYSASPNIIFYDVYAEQFTGASGPYTLWVEQHSSSSMEAIRKELREDEVYPANILYDSGTDEVQEDYGSGFVNNPSRDPRHATSLLYPPVTGADPKCLAAANMTDFFENLITAVEDALAGASSATALWAVILPFLIELGPFAVLIELVAALATVLFTAGDTALHAAFTTTTYDDLLCIFYCNIAADGSVSPAQLATIESTITTHFGVGVVNDVMLAALFLMGEVGLSNRGTLGASSRTCIGCACAWHYRWTFSVSDGGFVGWTGAGDPAANYVAGQGWRPADAGHGSGSCAEVFDGAFITATSFDIPTGTTITEIDAAGDNGSSCNHIEVWIGTDRLNGFSHHPYLYQLAFPGMDTGSIPAATGYFIGCALAGCDASPCFTQLDIFGFGDMPAFTGGTVI